MAAGDDRRSCTFNHQCFCRSVTSYCSPRIPRVAPGRDYEWILAAGAAADDRAAAWSLLVGFMSLTSPPAAGNTSHHLHLFRVARSGRVLGRSGDALEVLDDVDYDAGNPSPFISAVTATAGPDGRSLCLFRKEIRLDDLKHTEPPRPLLLDLDGGRKIAVSPLPGLPPQPFMLTRPISAAGDLWAPYLTEQCAPCRLVMLRLDKDEGRWVEVAAIDLPEKRKMPGVLTGRVLNGYAVVGHTILLSLNPRLQPDHPFFAFDCSTHALASVATIDAQAQKPRPSYGPIHGRGVYVEEDDTIYFLSGSCIFAYKLCQEQGQYRLALPVMVDYLCSCSEGYGFLTHLGNRVMCAVWISVDLRCNCDAFHVVIRTFRVEGSSGGSPEQFVPKGVQVLHSTCPQLDMLPSKPIDCYSEFCFLQEYEELNLENTMPLKSMEVITSSKVVESSKILACSRGKILNGFASLHSVMLDDDSAIQMNKARYIVCQVASRASVFKINILDGRLTCPDKTLAPLCTMDTFTCDIENEVFEFNLHQGTLNTVPEKRSDDVELSIALVLQVGGRIIALCDTLQSVYYLSRTYKSMHHSTYGLPDLQRKLNLSGYVVLNNDSFMISDADTCCCFLLDLQMSRWSAVYPYEELIRSLEYETELLPTGTGFLSGRSVFVDGFIYTCTDNGLSSYEVIEEAILTTLAIK